METMEARRVAQSVSVYGLSQAGRCLRAALTIIALFKLRVTSLLVFTAVTGYVMGSHGQVDWLRLSLLALGGGLAASGAAAVNQYLDRDLDALMARTAGRPLPSGSIRTPYKVLLVGAILILSGLALSLAISLAVAFMVALGAGIYLLAYTLWLKRRHPLNVVIGGVAGCCPVLAGWLAGAPELDATAWLLAGMVFAWTPPHFWSFALANRDDYRQAGIPMLPCIVPQSTAVGHIFLGTILTVALSLALSAMSGPGGPGLSAVVFASAVFCGSGVLLLLRPQDRTAWRHYKVANLFLATIFAVMLLDAAL